MSQFTLFYPDITFSVWAMLRVCEMMALCIRLLLLLLLLLLLNVGSMLQEPRYHNLVLFKGISSGKGNNAQLKDFSS